MKNKILALFASLSMSGFVFGDIQIGENVTIKGFLDASYQNTNSDVNTADSSDVSLDEVEIDFLFNSGAVSARVDLDTNPTVSPLSGLAGDDGLDIEQAHFTYTTDGGLGITVGRMGTTLGFEGEDPSGLYTYSRAYQDSSYNFGDIDGTGIFSRNDGIRLSYALEAFSLTGTIDQDTGTNLEGNDVNFEVSVAYTGTENLSLEAGYRNDKTSNAAINYAIWNVNAGYTAGKALVAAEYSNINPNDASRTLDAYMILLDYDFSDKLGGAIRYAKEDDSGSTTSSSSWTIAPNYSITENLGAILEYSDYEVGGANNDIKQLAVELTYTF